MLQTMSIEEVQATLPEIISKLGPGEEVLITQDDQPVAKLLSQPGAARQPRRPGSARGILPWLPKTQNMGRCYDFSIR